MWNVINLPFLPSLLKLGFCMFVLSLVKKHYRLQFYMVRDCVRSLGVTETLQKLNSCFLQQVRTLEHNVFRMRVEPRARRKGACSCLATLHPPRPNPCY